MNASTRSQTNRLLGYPEDARLLILNADDFGMCNSVNQAIIKTLEFGVVRSTSLMIACPWAMQAVNFLKEHPGIAFGVHLTVICDSDHYKWGPVAPKDRVPDLLDRAGYFLKPHDFPTVLNQASLDQLEVEFRAQIEAVLAAGLTPAQLDWHYIRLEGRTDLFELMLGLAQAYGLALRVTGQSFIQKAQSQGLPTNDYDFLDSYQFDPHDKPARYVQALRELPAGLSEWAVHPGFDHPELLALEPDGNHVRQTDFDFWSSRQAQEAISQEGIILIDYRALQPLWASRG